MLTVRLYSAKRDRTTQTMTRRYQPPPLPRQRLRSSELLGHRLSTEAVSAAYPLDLALDASSIASRF
jgi:hypothetical protein